MWQVSFRDVKVFPLTRLSPEVTRLNLLNAVIFKLFICLFDFYHQNAPSAFRQFLQNLGYKTDKRRGAALNEVGVRDPGPPIFNFNFQTTSVEIQVFMKACIKSAILTSVAKQLIFSDVWRGRQFQCCLNQWLISPPRNQISWIFALSMD